MSKSDINDTFLRQNTPVCRCLACNSPPKRKVLHEVFVPMCDINGGYSRQGLTPVILREILRDSKSDIAGASSNESDITIRFRVLELYDLQYSIDEQRARLIQLEAREHNDRDFCTAWKGAQLHLDTLLTKADNLKERILNL